MIFANSRYANQPVLRVLGSDGVTRPTVYREPQTTAVRFLHYTVKYGDRYDTLAAQFFLDPTLWWMLADANPEIFFPGVLTPGSVIRIPQG